MILGIESRTENWRTARCFAPLFGKRAYSSRGALGKRRTRIQERFAWELFWKGMRDFCFRMTETEYLAQVASSYRRLFPDLRKEVERFGKFWVLQAITTECVTNTRKLHLPATCATPRLISWWSRHAISSSERQKAESTFHSEGSYVHSASADQAIRDGADSC